ncbi:YbhB/YbcL family Raf kinase inhibitor-like protein [Bdellovibrionota bacterium FG-1]
MTSIDAFIHRRTIVLNQDTPVHTVAKAMRENTIGCALLMDGGGQLTGIVTDRDFACRWATNDPNKKEDDTGLDMPISKIMTPEILKANENSSLNDIISIMENYGVRRVPIIETGRQGREQVIGIVTLDDLIAAGNIAPSHLALIVRRQIGKRLAVLSRHPRSAQADRRSDARMHHTLDRFYSFFSQQTGLSAEMTPQVTQFLLGTLIMRVTATAATHFVAQLPKLIQDPLLRLPSGPNRGINYNYIIAELVSRYRLSEVFARDVFTHFLGCLETWMEPGQVHHLKRQLPLDLQAVFPPVAGVMTLSSQAFADHGGIPIQLTGEGADRSPPLSWSNIPRNAQELALICEDPDTAHPTPWVHWLIYGISPSVTLLPEGLPPGRPELQLPVHAQQGRNSWGNIGYQGPILPSTTARHRYIFRLYALSKPLSLPAGATQADLTAAMQGHIISVVSLIGSYQCSSVRKTA